jgi:hypothetical protein
MQLSERSELVKYISAIMAATSFGAIAEMAGGADRQDFNIKTASFAFGLSIVWSGYIYLEVLTDSLLAERGEPKAEWCSGKLFFPVFFPCVGIYAFGVSRLLNYFSPLAGAGAFLSLMLVIALKLVWKRGHPRQKEALAGRVEGTGDGSGGDVVSD